jgi:hypothetical protein
MLNYKSVRSSEPQIRSNPALRNVNESSGFQKRLSTLLEPTPLNFATFQIAKETSRGFLEQNQCYAWVRPAHLRSQKIIIADGMPLLLQDPKNEKGLKSLRIPFDKRQVQSVGPIVLEGSWDFQDHILWIWDVLVYEKRAVWFSMSYSKRWDLLKSIVNTILDCGHPMSDAEVRLPSWESLEIAKTYTDLDPATSIEFQPEKAGQRRHLFIIKNEGAKFIPKTHHERKMVAEAPTPRITHPVSNPLPPPPPAPALPLPPPSPPAEQERPRVARLTREKFSKLPDTYTLFSVGEPSNDLGLAAIRSLELSKRLRELMKTRDSIMVDISWFEPFQKYEVKLIHS